MCTTFTYESQNNFHFLGRNMDIEYEFNQNIIYLPINYPIKKVNFKRRYNVLGMGTIIDEHPMFADGFNEHGLACAGLNFPKFASYEDKYIDNKINITPYDFIYWVLTSFKSVNEFKNISHNINLINVPFSDDVPLPYLHWIITDKNKKTVTVEKTVTGFHVYDNKIGVLSNSPDFKFQLNNLNHYMYLSNKNPIYTAWGKFPLEENGEGLGLIGLPGDFYSTSRFVRASYFKTHCKNNLNEQYALKSTFDILDNLAMVNGSVITSQHKTEYTLYSSVLSLDEKIYYYKSNSCNQVNAVKMPTELDKLKIYPFYNVNHINYQN